jgi:hypothetical protein
VARLLREHLDAAREEHGDRDADVFLGLARRHQRVLTSATSFMIDSFASPNSITVFGL